VKGEATMTDDFKDGDTVQLKSGGPMMTIGHLGTQTRSSKAQGAWCDWFDETQASRGMVPANVP